MKHGPEIPLFYGVKQPGLMRMTVPDRFIQPVSRLPISTPCGKFEMVLISQNEQSPLERRLCTETVSSLRDTESIPRIIFIISNPASSHRPNVAVGRISLSRTLAIRAVCRANHGTHSVQEIRWQDAGRSRDPLRRDSSEKANGSKRLNGLGLPLLQDLN